MSLSEHTKNGDYMLEIGQVLDGKYRILSEIGRGGMSVVYLALNDKVNVTWAVKEIRDDGSNASSVIIEGMRREIETLRNVKHPKIPKIIEVYDHNESFIIVMDYIEGSSLNRLLPQKGIITDSGPQLIDTVGPHPEDKVVDWIKQVCDVLQYLHTREKSIIHRDIKPANIMLDPKTRNITVIDFGTAKQCEVNDKNGLTTCLGTPGYAAPEQYGGLGRTDPRTDIYALGMTMYALLTGIDPQRNLVIDTSIRKVNPALSPGLDEIVLKCTERDAANRYESCADLLYALDNYKINDAGHRKKKRIKVAAFITSLLLSAACGVTSLVFSNQAKLQATDSYKQILDDASTEMDYDKKITLYLQAIDVPDKAGDSEAYIQLIQCYKDNDKDNPTFTNDEAEQLQKLILNNRSALEANEDGYIEICFETGKLFWYFYEDENQVTRAKYALDWFQKVTSRTDSSYKNYGLATVYQNIGVFYRDITSKLNEASDTGMYSELFVNMNNLINTVAKDNSENEIVRLELLEMVRSALHRYPSQFKRDGVSKEEITALYEEIESLADTISVPNDENDKSFQKKEQIKSYLPETKTAIETAYSVETGGDVK